MGKIRRLWQALAIVSAPKFEVGVDKPWHLDVPVLRLDFYAITASAMINAPPTTISVGLSAARNSFLPTRLCQAVHKIIEDFIFATLVTDVEAFLPRWDDS